MSQAEILHLKYKHRVGGTWMSGSIIEDVAFILGEVTDVEFVFWLSRDLCLSIWPNQG